MVRISMPKPAKGFKYSDEPQRSPQWVGLGIGRVTSSNLHRWMAVAKRPNKDGVHPPLKARTDYEREIAFEKRFKTSFNKFVTSAMQQGIDNEPFLREEYEKKFGVKVDEAGCFYNDFFRASPDGLVGLEGGVEFKWLLDTSWTEVVASGRPYAGSSGDHMLQVQGNLLATGRKWWDYVAGNPTTGRFTIIRITPDKEIMAAIAESVKEVAQIPPLKTNDVFEFSHQIPENIVESIEEDVWAQA